MQINTVSDVLCDYFHTKPYLLVDKLNDNSTAEMMQWSFDNRIAKARLISFIKNSLDHEARITIEDEYPTVGLYECALDLGANIVLKFNLNTGY